MGRLRYSPLVEVLALAGSALDSLSDEEIAEALARPKFMSANLDWEEKPSNSAFRIAGSLLMDDTAATIPGITVELFYRVGSISPDDCKYSFTVFKLKGGKRRRLYSIDVRPNHRSSHRGSDGKWYGPHQHFGENARKLDGVEHLGCPDYEEWFRVFLKQANINFGGKYHHPERQPRLPNVV